MIFTGITQGAFQLLDIKVGEPFEKGEQYFLKIDVEIPDGEENILSFNAVNLETGYLQQFEPDENVSKVEYELNFYEYTGETQINTEE